MPRDLFKEAGISPEPRDLFQESGVNSEQGRRYQPGFVESHPALRYPADILIGLSKGGRTLANIPSQIAGLFNPELGQKLASPISGEDIEQSFGVTNPSIADIVLQHGAEAAGLGRLAVPGVISAGKKVYELGKELPVLESFRPQKHAEKIMQEVIKGRSADETRQEIAKNLQDVFSKRNLEEKAKYAPVMKGAGKESIYPEQAGGYGVRRKGEFLLNTDKDLFDQYGLGKYFDKFSQDPSVQNAHDLQSIIGSTMRKIEHGKLPLNKANDIRDLRDARDVLKQELMGHLENQHPELAEKYQEGLNYTREKMAPFYGRPKLFEIAKGDIENPSQEELRGIFRSPQSDLIDIAQENPSLKDNITSALLREQNINLKPEKLQRTIDLLKERGYEKYFTPEMQELHGQLGSKISARNIATASALRGAIMAALGKFLGL